MNFTSNKFLFLLLIVMSFHPSISIAQNTRVSKPACVVAEFKMATFSSHMPSVRSENAKNWLLKNLVTCSDTQLGVISSNLASWLGTALTHEVSAIMDGIYERKMLNSGANIKEYYNPTVKTSSSVESYSASTPPAPVVSPAGGTNIVVGGVGNVVGNNAEEKKSERGDDKELKANFRSNDRFVVASYFDEFRGDKECPAFMKPKGEKCISVRGGNKQWKLNQPLESGVMAADISIGLREKLGAPPPNFKYMQVNEDILLVTERGNVVVDMILDFGGVLVKAPTQQKTAPKA